MKIRYLSHEDRENLRVLRHTKDPDVIIAVLESIFKRNYYTLQALWEYRKWFLSLDEEQLMKHPSLVCGTAQIYQMSGEPDKADKLIELLPKDSVYYVTSKLVLQEKEPKEFGSLLRQIRDNNWRMQAFTLTAGRPTVINGICDLTPYADFMEGNKETLIDLIGIIYPESKEIIYEVMLAEAMYQRDDCYGALVKIVGLIPFLKDAQEMRILFAALTLETYILVLNGQAQTTVPLMEKLRQQMIHNELAEYLPNIDALDAWAAMYDCDYVRVARWMRDSSPDEHGKFCMLDLFRYMIKMRAYIIQGKYMAVTALAGRLLPLLEQGNRYMDTCELHMIWAMSDQAAGREKEALGHMEKALKLAECYRYDRLLADEGKRVHDLLRLYQKERGRTPYNERVKKLAEKAAAMYPRYLKTQLPKKPALTETEMKVLRLLSACYTNAEIAEMTETAVDTVKQHCKHICAKLEVRNRHQAVDRAVELGIIEPVQIKPVY